MIKETFTLFLSHQQQTLGKEKPTEQNSQTHAAKIIQVTY
jgi:hypothetical protein